MKFGNVTKILSIAAISLVMVGCGGGNSSTPIEIVDNSTIAEGQNSLGYYGEQVKFGNHIGVGKWSYTHDGDTMYAELDNEGIAYLSDNDGWGGGTIYGISKDGQEISFDGGSVLTLYNATSSNCYNANMLNMDHTENLDIAVCKM